MSGYFIELLKCLHPNAIVAYFFCRSGQPGLMNARDIIRTLAYQCLTDDKKARAVLDSLLAKKFKIDENMGIRFLFEKLLQEPLSQTANEVFIVFDGVDEGDCTTLDTTDRPHRPELDILLNCLGQLPSARLLFVSRPNADISKHIPNSVTKSLGKNDNMDDIDAYVRTTLEASELRSYFEKEKIDPFQYFHDKANGIFLWVVIVLHQLGQTKSSSMFKKYLAGFSDASGSMERLYAKVLSSFEGEDLKWVREILKWLVIAEAELSVHELQTVVEWSLHDSLHQFTRFLEVDCGALLHLIPIKNEDRTNAQLIHETLRSFLLNEACCPPPFYVAEKAAHFYALRACLDILSTEGLDDGFNIYACSKWQEHLNKAGKPEPDHFVFSTLASIHRFFHSKGCERWIESLFTVPVPTPNFSHGPTTR